VTTVPTQAAATEFVDFFAAGWVIGARDPEAFFRHFGPRMHPEHGADSATRSTRPRTWRTA
jgi:hypothetical protein